MKINKKLFSEEKAITLIALVITIIVLLILAGISIAMLSGDNSILSKSTEARERTGISQTEETIKLSYAAALTNGNGTIDKDSFKAELQKEFGTEKVTDETIDDTTQEGKWIVTIDGATVTLDAGGTTATNPTTPITSNKLVAMFQKAVADGCTNADGTCTREDHLHIGDYVNYTNPTSGEYTVPAGELGGTDAQTYLASQNQLNWRVLGLEGTGDTAYIKLIAGSPMKKSKADKSGTDESNPYLYMKGAKSYINAVVELNKICAICKNDSLATKAESITMNDIDKLTGIASNNADTYKANIRNYNIADNGSPYNYGDSFSFSNQWTPETWIANGNTAKVVNGQDPTGAGAVSDTVDGYEYAINAPEGFPMSSVTMSNNRIYNMLFDNVEFGSGRAYWLASVGVLAGSVNAGFSPAIVGEAVGVVNAGTNYMFGSVGSEIEYSFAVRPVVYLKSGVTSEQCSKIADKTETTWNYGGGSGGGDIIG